MNIVDSRITVRRYVSKTQYGGVQRLEKDFLAFGVAIWSVVLDTEDYPSWAHISLCTLGYSDFTSKFAGVIDAEAEAARAKKDKRLWHLFCVGRF